LPFPAQAEKRPKSGYIRASSGTVAEKPGRAKEAGAKPKRKRMRVEAESDGLMSGDEVVLRLAQQVLTCAL